MALIARFVDYAAGLSGESLFCMEVRSIDLEQILWFGDKKFKFLLFSLVYHFQRLGC